MKDMDLNLASIPSDISRRIISFVDNESVEPARLVIIMLKIDQNSASSQISPSWNSLVLDAYDKTKIDTLRFDFSKSYVGERNVCILHSLKFSGPNKNMSCTIREEVC